MMHFRLFFAGAATVCTAVAATPLRGSAQEAAASGDTLTLIAAVHRSLESNPVGRAADAGASEAAARAGQASAQRFPQLGLQGALTRYQEPWIVAPLHGFDPNVLPAFESTLLQGGLTATYTLFDGGGRGARIGSARAHARAADAHEKATRQQVVADAVQAYLAALAAEDQLQAVEASVAALAAERRRVEQFFGEGRAARVDVLRAAAAVAAIEADRVSARTERDVARRTLARAIGAAPGVLDSGVLVSVRLTDRPPPTREAALAAFEANSPDLEQARASRDAAVEQARVARAAWFPQLDLVGGYLGYGSTQGHFSAEWQAGVRLAYPLFTGGARARAVVAANAGADQADGLYEAARLRGADAVDRAVSRIEEQHARAAAIATAADHSAEVARIEQLSLEAGAGTETDFLRAEADLRGARAKLIRARYGEIDARVQLARLTGTLTPDFVIQLVETNP